ncbi:MAG: hypothetical protein Q3977_00760 [Oscillospiraceae bacterium]|nr:hypothetical protein [Oscillospiraceae bacterium]
MKPLPDSFLTYAADTLAGTSSGLSGSQIVKYSNSYAVDFGVDIPVSNYPWGDFGKQVPNKRSALLWNLQAFNGQQQYIIIKEMCEFSVFSGNDAVQKLKRLLIERYGNQFGDSFSFEKCEETGWKRIDKAIEEMQNRFLVADTVEKYNAIALIGRQVEIQIAREVYKPSIHGTMDGDIEIGNADAKRMLQAYLKHELGNSEKAIKMARASIDLCNQTTHDFSATKRNALLCISAVKAIASMIKSIEDTQE